MGETNSKAQFLRVIYILVVLCVAAEVSYSQNEEGTAKYLKLNGSYAFSIAVSQEDSPVTFETIDFLSKSDGSIYSIRYVLRNKTEKVVSRIGVAFEIRHSVGKWKRYGSGSEIEINSESDARVELIQPYGSYESDPQIKPGKIPETVHRLFENNPGYRGFRGVIIVGKVKLIEFTDGSKFEDSSPVFTEFFDSSN